MQVKNFDITKLFSFKTRNARWQSAFTIGLILILSASTIAALIPAASAHSPAWNIPTYAYVTTIPKTQQVNHLVQVVMWLNTIVPTAGGLGGDRWRGFKVDVTAPDGSKSQLGPFTSDQVGTSFTTFTPSQVGNYTLVFSWPGQTLSNGTGAPYPGGAQYVGDNFLAATSDPAFLVVQQGPIPVWQNTPTPTGFWTLPVNALNRDNFGSLASNWLNGGWLKYNFQPAGQGPNSAHVLWQKPIPDAPHGILDAQWPTTNTNVRDYETPFATSYGSSYNQGDIIINGVLYFPTPLMSTTPGYGYYAYDLYTGKQLWYNNGSSIPANPALGTGTGGSYLASLAYGSASGPSLSLRYPQLAFGQLLHYYAANGAGVVPYLWATGSPSNNIWYMLDAGTGNWILTIKNVPSGTTVVDQDGNILVYSYSSATGNLLCWNSSQAIPPTGPVGSAQQQWRPPIGATIDALNDTSWTTYPITSSAAWTASDVLPRSGYTMNVTIPKGLGSISQVLLDSNRMPRQIFGWANPGSSSSITGGAGIANAWCVQINYYAVPYSPFPDKTYTQNNNLGYTATLLWNRTYPNPNPTGNITYLLGPVSYNDQVFTVWAKETRQWYGYSLTDGSLMWGPTSNEQPYNLYNAIARMDEGGASTAYGILFSGGFGGVLYGYNMTTGKLMWNYVATGIDIESPYGNYPMSIGAIADGKIYVYTDLGYVQQPVWRGAKVRAIDVYSGKEVWSIYSWAIGEVYVASGYAVYADQYNNMINCIGKGPSATTVSTQDFAAPLGTPVMITGTVTDQSPSATGTPAISEQNMEQWMEYLYDQQAKPINATGVSVHLTAVDPNGNIQEIGTPTSDITGSYAVQWTPPVPGVYKITATFGGSASYGDSSAQTSLLVSPAVSAAIVTPTPSTPISTATPTVSPLVTPTPTTPQGPGGIQASTIYAIAAAVVIIVIVAAAAVALRRRK